MAQALLRPAPLDVVAASAGIDLAGRARLASHPRHADRRKYPLDTVLAGMVAQRRIQGNVEMARWSVG